MPVGDALRARCARSARGAATRAPRARRDTRAYGAGSPKEEARHGGEGPLSDVTCQCHMPLGPGSLRARLARGAACGRATCANGAAT